MEEHESLYDPIFVKIMDLLEYVSTCKQGRFKDIVSTVFTGEDQSSEGNNRLECIQKFSHLQYTVTSQSLALRITRFMKHNFADMLMDSPEEALLVFDLAESSLESKSKSI